MVLLIVGACENTRIVGTCFPAGGGQANVPTFRFANTTPVGIFLPLLMHSFPSPVPLRLQEEGK